MRGHRSGGRVQGSRPPEAHSEAQVSGSRPLIVAPFSRLFHVPRKCSTREARTIHAQFFESQGESQGRDFSPLTPSVSVSYPTACRSFRLYLPSTSGLSRRRSRVRVP